MRFFRPRIKIQKLKTKRQLAKATGVAFLLTLLVATVGQIDFHSHAATGSGLTATYFGNPYLTNPKFTRIDNTIDFNWGDTRVNSKLPDSNNYSVRWEGFIQPRNTEDYTFTTLSDDGVRLWINNQLVIDNWTEHPTTENIGTIGLAANQRYSIKMEYYEHWGMAVAKLYWSSPSQLKEIVPQSQLSPIGADLAPASETSIQQPITNQAATTSTVKAEYFNDRNLTSPALQRLDSSINFNWNGGSPDPVIGSDNFSARWTGKITPNNSENYTFYTVSDDGVRVWVNNLLVINNWSDHPVTQNMGILALEAGQSYDVKVEYYENSGQSILQFFWSSPSLPKSAVTFTSTATASTSVPAVDTLVQNIQASANSVSQPVNMNNPFAGAKLYVNPNNDPANYVRNNQGSYNAQMMDKIAKQPEVTWLGGWNSNISNDVSNTIKNVGDQGAMPVFVVYNIPYRDCGGYSSGGVNDPASYRNWIGQIASAIGSRKAAVILEPDAITLTDCLSSDQKSQRFQLLKDAVNTFNSHGTAVYIDAGHPNWLAASDIASRLKQAGVDNAAGFSLNVANFYTNEQNANYGKQISDNLGGKHFVVDTGRNGSGPTADEQWCNPSGRSLGTTPTTNTSNPLIDAYLWVKGPGGSDGNCNGGPNAGQFWPDYAIGLAQRANW